MKKIIILVGIFILTGVTTNLIAQKDRRLSKGFSICLVTGFPSEIYGYEKGSQVDEPDQLGGIWGLKLGSRWYFSPKETYGFGLMVNWIDLSMATKPYSTSGDNSTRAVADFSFLQLGPVATFAVSKDIALDAYYNLRPTVFEHLVVTTNGDYDGYGGLGLANSIGGAFRYKILNLGVEYVFGSITSNYITTSSSTGTTHDSKKLLTNSFRILIGIKL